ncbi:hypothetical protein Nstercoris_00688 [Nitrosomonas stercoris]|uniref:Uncharacterized protein n=1 Tax=Nitrosomonas stercoris TaxID=1444684 RepID=A0A4Y1YJW2_9PROT|nr:hypothetical protein Nstercoris_00688 [Nitrosomonas stercoris]
MSSVEKGSDADTTKKMILGTVLLLLLILGCVSLAVYLTPPPVVS